MRAPYAFSPLRPSMSLREQLRDILPQILPADPAEAIKGTELIRLVRFRLGEEYSDATLRYHFSILSYDPTSPIAKVDQGQGYYFRQTQQSTVSNSSQARFGDGSGERDQEFERDSRFRGIVERYCLHNSRHPFLLTSTSGKSWELPDLIITDWDFDEDPAGALKLDETLLNLKQHLGVPVVTLTGVQLFLSVTLDSCLPAFFQTLSSTRWANHGEIFIAEKVRDAALVETLRRLGHEYGIGVTSFGLDLTLLDELPAADDIRGMTAGEFESLQTLLPFQRIAVSTPRAHLDWPHLSMLKKKHARLDSMLSWINDCLESKQPQRFGPGQEW